MTTWTVTKGILLAAGIIWIFACAVRAYGPAEASAASPYRNVHDAQLAAVKVSDRITHRHIRTGQMFWLVGCANRITYFACSTEGVNRRRTVACNWVGIVVPLSKARRPHGPTGGGCLVSPSGTRVSPRMVQS